MAHLTETLPSQVEQGAVRLEDYEVEIVETDGGYEDRNLRHANPKREYEISFPTSKRDAETYLAVVSLYHLAKGRLHSFTFKDWTTGEHIPVRFDSPLRITGIDQNLDHIETLTLREVFL